MHEGDRPHNQCWSGGVLCERFSLREGFLELQKKLGITEIFNGYLGFPKERQLGCWARGLRADSRLKRVVGVLERRK